MLSFSPVGMQIYSYSIFWKSLVSDRDKVRKPRSFKRKLFVPLYGCASCGILRLKHFAIAPDVYESITFFWLVLIASELLREW